MVTAMSNIDTLAVTMIVALRRPVGFAAACLVMGLVCR
jgi:hypothetical protein